MERRENPESHRGTNPFPPEQSWKNKEVLDKTPFSPSVQTESKSVLRGSVPLNGSLGSSWDDTGALCMAPAAVDFSFPRIKASN